MDTTLVSMSSAAGTLIAVSATTHRTPAIVMACISCVYVGGVVLIFGLLVMWLAKRLLVSAAAMRHQATQTVPVAAGARYTVSCIVHMHTWSPPRTVPILR